MIGPATRLSRYITGLDKTYTATARFGATSDTLDADGDIVDLDTPMPAEHEVRAALKNFTGGILQIPPMASALKVGGERLYSLHRKGITVERESRPVTIHVLTLTSVDPAAQTATFKVSCSSGTYVRSLISDLAASLGTGAYLAALRRTSVGHLKLEDATIPGALTSDNLHSRIIQINEVVSHLPKLEVGADERSSVCNGRPISSGAVRGAFRVSCGEELLAIYRGDGSGARAEVVLCQG